MVAKILCVNESEQSDLLLLGYFTFLSSLLCHLLPDGCKLSVLLTY